MIRLADPKPQTLFLSPLNRLELLSYEQERSKSQTETDNFTRHFFLQDSCLGVRRIPCLSFLAFCKGPPPLCGDHAA